MSAQSSPFASALGLMQSSDQLRSLFGDVDISWISSTWPPVSYLPLSGFDDSIFLRRIKIQKSLQKIVYKLCSLALACREDIIFAQPRPIIAQLDQILSLGFEDMNSWPEFPQTSTATPLYFNMGREDGNSVMEQYLFKIYEVLRKVEGLTINRTPGE
jgi:hypothetical protein